jgi:hypothetical protein
LQGGAEFDDPESYQSKALARREEQVGIENMTVAKTAQYYSLYCIYNATNKVPNVITDADVRFDMIAVFPDWRTATGWEENDVDPCDGWFGITCLNGQVRTIDLFGNILTGAWPPEASLLAADGERSTGAGRIFRVDLFDNEFLFNNFDNSWMTFLGSELGKFRWKNEYCAHFYCDLIILLSYTLMVAEYLYFQQTAFAGDLAKFPPNLYEIDFSFTLITGGLTDEVWGGLNNLNWALLEGNAFNNSVPAAFGDMLNLEFLYISDSFISGDLSYMEGMPKIVEHWIDVNPGLGGPVFSFIGALSTLQSFSVTQSALAGQLPTELGNLDNMVQMWFYANSLTGQIPSELGNLSKMVLLQLEGNAFTGSMPTEVCDNVGFLSPLLTLGADCLDPNFTVSSWELSNHIFCTRHTGTCTVQHCHLSVHGLQARFSHTFFFLCPSVRTFVCLSAYPSKVR